MLLTPLSAAILWITSEIRSGMMMWHTVWHSVTRQRPIISLYSACLPYCGRWLAQLVWLLSVSKSIRNILMQINSQIDILSPTLDPSRLSDSHGVAKCESFVEVNVTLDAAKHYTPDSVTKPLTSPINCRTLQSSRFDSLTEESTCAWNWKCIPGYRFQLHLSPL